MSQAPRPHRDADYFRQSSRSNTTQLSDNWVLRFSALKRLYRLLTQYFTDVLQKPTTGLEVPDLQGIAKDNNVGATLVLCRMTIAIAVQSEKNKGIIERIQKLNESAQHQLMKAIEQVSSQGWDVVRCVTFCMNHSLRTGHVEDQRIPKRPWNWWRSHDRVSPFCTTSANHVTNLGQRRSLLPDTVRA